MATGESIMLLSLIILALGLTAVSLHIRILPFSLASMIAWIALDIGFVTGDIGPGFGVLWVEAIAILFTLLAFAPLVVQTLEDVSHESNYGGEILKWKTVKVKGWKAGDEDPYMQHRNKIRDIANKRNTKRPKSQVRDKA